MNIFVYGSLMSEKTRTYVMGYSHPDFEAGKIAGFHRFCIENRTYPALCEMSEKEEVTGILLKSVSVEGARILDQFEGDEYQRSPVQVFLPSGEKVEAWAYMWANGAKDPQLYGNWSFEKDFLPNEEKTLQMWKFIS